MSFYGLYPLVNKANGFGEAEVNTYVTNIIANGGTISGADVEALNAFVFELKASGVWNNLVEIYPIMGNNLAAAMTKLKYVTNPYMINNNFVSGDYVETGPGGGLTGDGATKYADLTLPMNNGIMTQYNAGMGVYITNIHSGMTTEGVMGLQYGPLSYEIFDNNTGAFFNQNITLVFTGGSNALLTNDITTSGAVTLYYRGTQVNAATVTGYPSTNTTNMYLLATQANIIAPPSPRAFSADTVAFAFQSLYLGPTQQASLYSAVQALQTYLGRQV